MSNGTNAQWSQRKRSRRNGHFAQRSLRSWTLRGRTLRGQKIHLEEIIEIRIPKFSDTKLCRKKTFDVRIWRIRIIATWLTMLKCRCTLTNAALVIAAIISST